MAFEITIPRLGWSMEEGTFVRWLKRDGDTVTPGEALFELEGEKAAQDVEAVDGGILRIPATAPKPGTVVAVGAVVGYLVAEGEAAPGGARAVSSPSQPDACTATIVASAPAAAPSVRRMAREMGVDLAQIVGSGPAGRIFAADLGGGTGGFSNAAVAVGSGLNEVMMTSPRGTSTPGGSSPPRGESVAVASPRARRVARELGIDWTALTGSGRGGRVRERDVRAIATAHRVATRSTLPLPVAGVAGATIPVTRHRRTIAERMLYSRQHTAPVTLTTRVDATNLVNLREQFKQSAGGNPVPSYSDIVAKLVAIRLTQHPLLAARWADDHLIVPDVIDLGIAVDTDAGLMVPVVRDVPSLSLIEFTRRTQSLIARARAGELTAADIRDGVFTITNLGAFGIDAFTPIINVPETAILGLGRIRREPAVVGDAIVARDQMTLSLTFDHRIVDGAPAARFLQALSQSIENPSAALLQQG